MKFYLGVCPGCGHRVYVEEDAPEMFATCDQCTYTADPDVFVDEAIRVDGVDG